MESTSLIHFFFSNPLLLTAASAFGLLLFFKMSDVRLNSTIIIFTIMTIFLFTTLIYPQINKILDDHNQTDNTTVKIKNITKPMNVVIEETPAPWNNDWLK